MSDILKAEREIFNQVFAIDKLRVSSFTGEMALRIDEADANTIYIGKAKAGSSPFSPLLNSLPLWQIRKIVVSGTLTSVLWADGDIKFDNIWNDRTTLTYY
jgi:hypothetical protein